MTLSGSDTFQSVDMRRLGDCLQKAPYGILITNETGIILFMTDAISDIAGYVSGETVGSSILEFIISKDWAIAVDLFPIPDEMGVTRKIHFVRKNGVIWYVDIKVRKVEGYIYWYIIDTPNA